MMRTAVASGDIYPGGLLQIVTQSARSRSSLDDLMQEIADIYQSEVEYELKTLSSQIEPILILMSPPRRRNLTTRTWRIPADLGFWAKRSSNDR